MKDGLKRDLPIITSSVGGKEESVLLHLKILLKAIKFFSRRVGGGLFFLLMLRKEGKKKG